VEIASTVAQPQKTMLQNEITSCTILGIEYVHILLAEEFSIGTGGFAMEINGHIMMFKLPMTIAAVMMAAPLSPSAAYGCPEPGTSSDNNQPHKVCVS